MDKIEESAFSGCSNIASVILGNSIREICKNAFNACEGLDSLVIPSSVKIIEDDAFAWNKLNYLAIYGDFENLGWRVFSPKNDSQLHIDFHCKRIGEEWFLGRIKEITMPQKSHYG